ncbi:enoyl-CoA hydratase-related protein [Mesoterricola sediminis]|uniref:Enoyl-CoA hydratase n=1 Tax=Mesoterricola sediminis TaxID=2927980 RepID=A0AA48KDA2_9BACT|nr:enoyl-CoA hydratase-related protein [Mesoterricola sediminis]BDU76102.1 enoyl-CoA hydratase [Mesoterricola sediminis]
MTDLAAFPVASVPYRGQYVRMEARACGVRRLVLDRPEVRNAFNAAMIREIGLAVAELGAAPQGQEVRLLLLDAEGPVFCAGADLATMKEQGAATPEQNLEAAREVARMFHRLASFPAPVVCAVRGAAIGGGLGLTTVSDLVLAEPTAAFATSEVLLGIVPAVIGPYIVRKIGLANAAPLMLTGRRIRGAEALALGLVQRLAEPPGTFDEALTRLVRECLAAGPRAARATRELLRRISPLPDPELMEFTAHTIASARGSAEGQEGLKAFFRKAAPSWVPGAE